MYWKINWINRKVQHVKKKNYAICQEAHSVIYSKSNFQKYTWKKNAKKKSENTYEFFFLWNGPHVSALLLPISLKFFLPQSFSYITFFSGVFTKCRVELLWLWHKCKSIFPRGSSITARYDGSKMKLSLSHFDNKRICFI